MGDRSKSTFFKEDIDGFWGSSHLKKSLVLDTNEMILEITAWNFCVGCCNDGENLANQL